MAVIGINGSSLFAAGALKQHYGLSIEQARIFKTCAQPIEVDEATEQRLVDEGLAMRFTMTIPPTFKED
jgi:hypothetical protein